VISQTGVYRDNAKTFKYIGYLLEGYVIPSWVIVTGDWRWRRTSMNVLNDDNGNNTAAQQQQQQG